MSIKMQQDIENLKRLYGEAVKRIDALERTQKPKEREKITLSGANK